MITKYSALIDSIVDRTNIPHMVDGLFIGVKKATQNLIYIGSIEQISQFPKLAARMKFINITGEIPEYPQIVCSLD